MKQILRALAVCCAMMAAPTSAADPGGWTIYPPAPEHTAIWGAIAYSPADGEYGIFWGADRRDEARATAFSHCENAGGAACEDAVIFSSPRNANRDDGFVHMACAALARSVDAGPSVWAAQAAKTRAQAEEMALGQCRIEGGQCEIMEWVCT